MGIGTIAGNDGPTSSSNAAGNREIMPGMNDYDDGWDKSCFRMTVYNKLVQLMLEMKLVKLALIGMDPGTAPGT
jgi:hypothetical protein